MATKVNQTTSKTYALKKLAKKKRIGTGDGGQLSEKALDRAKKKK